ncbi:hypothetical protein Goklo_022787 [Gossypium klotzschianum]|uniref:Rho GTPase-activating protein 5-like n=1 Tax=Gossypium klotzschianum TaxID=34286 RepID=A0A7J8TNG4_9ROSI|nr:hypothetical protein [Gossypium klotzschianum]
MTEVLHFSSPPSAENSSSSSSTTSDDDDDDEGGDPRVEEEGKLKKRSKQEGDQFSVLAFLVTLFRKSWTSGTGRELCGMDIGIPTNVRHVSHVTFDRFRGFLGLPVEFEPEVPTRVPSASANVFGVSTESMQLSYDSRGNSVPAILLLMQRNLFALGGFQAEGIFRITGDNSQVEYVREQLNRGVVPEEVDAHCLAGLIKAWFRELPSGVLDSLDPQQVMQCETEEQCTQLARLLPPTEYALLDWAINLMADVVQQEHLNKMNARNIAVVFAPNMTQMADPLTALVYSVQVMNFLKTLISKTLREREYSMVEPTEASYLEPFDDDGDQRPSIISCITYTQKDNEEKETAFIAQEPLRASFRNYSQNNETADGEEHSPIPSVYKQISAEDTPTPARNNDIGESSNSSPGNKINPYLLSKPFLKTKISYRL